MKSIKYTSEDMNRHDMHTTLCRTEGTGRRQDFRIIACMLCLCGVLCLAGAATAVTGLDPVTYGLCNPDNLVWDDTEKVYKVTDATKLSNITVNVTVPAGYNISAYGVHPWTAELSIGQVTDYENCVTNWVGGKNMSGTTYTMAYAAQSNSDVLNGITKDLVCVTIDARSILNSQVENITIPIELSPREQSIEGNDNITITVNVKIRGSAELTFLSYNGYFTDKNGAYIKNSSEPSKNITDVLTGVEYASITPTISRFNSSIKAEMTYSCSASSSVDGVISIFSKQPVFYSVSTVSLKMNESTVDVFNANGELLGSGTGSFVNGKYQHNAVIPAGASYLNVTFTGRKLGDVDGNDAINAFDSLKINKKVAHKLDFSDEDSFFGDFDQSKNIDAFDSLGVNKKVAHKDTYWWI